MNPKTKKILVYLFTALAVVLVPQYVYREFPSIFSSDECIGSFDDFAYHLSSKSAESDQITPPLSPWKVESNILEASLGGDNFKYSVVLTRVKQNYTEVWVRKYVSIYRIYPEYEDEYQFLIYRTDTKEWKTIVAEIENSGIFVDELFSTSDGTIWGHIFWDSSSNPIAPAPLARFAESRLEFEIVSEAQEISAFSKSNKSQALAWSKVLLDMNDRFWILVPNDAIYSYTPAARALMRHAEIIDIDSVYDAVYDPSGAIFISDIVDPINDVHTLNDVQFIRFDIKAGTLETLKNPWGIWPYPGNIFVDDAGKLWLGATGWRGPLGNWHMIYPWRSIAEGYGIIRWPSDPSVLLESSDGRLWYRRFLDNHNYWGMAWLNPRTMQGCWFTSAYTGIKEDQNYILWLTAYGKLYKYELDQ